MADGTRRVLHVLSQRPGWTGSGTTLDALVRAAAGAGWTQSVVVGTPADDPVPSVGGLSASCVEPLRFETAELPFPVPGMSDVMPYRSSRFAALTTEQLERYRAAWRRHLGDVVRRVRPDVVHAHHLWLLGALLKDVAPDVPVVTHCHGTGFRQLALCPGLADEVVRGCRRNDRFLVLHDAHADELERLGFDRARVVVVGSGFRPDVFHDRGRPPGGAPAIVYAGKLSRAKGLPWLLDAFERLRRRRPAFELHVAGSGDGREARQIRERIDALPGAHAHGQLAPDELAARFRRSSLLVLPSFYEGLPLVLVEAAACGCRIVATDVPGVVAHLAPRLGDALELVERPPLEAVDRPVAAALPAFVERLESATERSLSRPPLHDVAMRVSGFTWRAVFDAVERVWRELYNS